MPKTKSPRKGSLQFWPRKRARKVLPRTNWAAISSSHPLKGFIAYKAGMVSAIVKDKTPDSMTKDKKVAFGATVLECPPMKIFAVRFYNEGHVVTDAINEQLEKTLKRKVKLPKKTKAFQEPKIYDDISLLVYSLPHKAKLKKTPDVTEIGLQGSLDEKLAFAKEHLTKEIGIEQVFETGTLVDVRGLSKGKGFQGPVKRFGIKLRSHKSEKGVRKVGSIGPWHPARVSFRVPMAGQMGLHTRTVYNLPIVALGSATEAFPHFKNYGPVTTTFLLLKGSIQGPAKRAILVSAPLRVTKRMKKKAYEFLEVSK